MEHICICPKCGAAFGCEENSRKICSDCNELTVDTGYGEPEWYALVKSERLRRINDIRSSFLQTVTDKTGVAPKTGNTSSGEHMDKETKRIFGIILLVVGIIGCIYAASVISDDTSRLFGYNYAPPLTSHESTMIWIAVLSGIAVFAGGIMLYLSSSDRGGGDLAEELKADASRAAGEGWICSHCGSLNPDSFQKCKNCYTLRRRG